MNLIELFCSGLEVSHFEAKKTDCRYLKTKIRDEYAEVREVREISCKGKGNSFFITFTLCWVERKVFAFSKRWRKHKLYCHLFKPF
jgi:hypothetical protein